MIISTAVQTDYKRWAGFLEKQVIFSFQGSAQHTKAHCARVLLFALLIAEKRDLPPEEREVLCAAAVFHDSRRQDDWLDTGHGARAAGYYQKFCETGGLAYDARASRIMAFHDLDDIQGEAALKDLTDGVLLYRIFKDADALDRFRLGPNGLDLQYLRTNEARELVGFAKKFLESAKGQVSISESLCPSDVKGMAAVI